ncbi:thiol reductant ABC exporter subunit CydC [Streptococcus porcinus]|uniref:Thiol reductant ABC exporter, CydC subunit n=1 Tax=Streptococcus porcinus str. Jelinkova 176 TaxID=873448 RepID=A0ABP2KYZ8_STRPO|nr:thiol reductant ABC exporter subunit CydC [Streptococcus porcinus]EGJ27212.1 thiol reductant ABC exporter, CydC subunit [Streptococcus porcinus str. Jelinkova 176]SQG42382.1 ABC transporter ATP-binding protein [Streptococcus porcinus]
MLKIPLLKAFEKDQWVKPYFKHYWKALVLALILGFLTFFSASALMFNSGFLISKSASLPSNILLVYIPIVLTRAFGIGRPVFRYLERLTSHNWVLKMTSKLRLKLYNRLEEDAIFLKRNHRLGDIMGLLAEDINHIQNLYLRTIFPTIIAWVLYSFVVLAVGYFSWWFAIVLFFYLGLLVVVFPLWSVLVNGARQEQEKVLKNRLYTDLTDNVLGISDWIFSQRGHAYVQLHERSEAELAQVQAEMRRFNNRRSLLFEMAFGLLAVLVLVWASYQFSGIRGGAANWIAAFVLSVFPLVEAFAGLSSAAQETNVYADSIKGLNDLPVAGTLAESQNVPKEPFTIQVDKVSFSYDGQSNKVLDTIDLTIEQGQKLAILGQSGSGKSTLATLLRGDLRPSQGRILLGGVDVCDLSDSIADYIGVIQQAPYLFNTSLINNIRLGNEAATEQDVWRVLEQVGLKNMVLDLSKGLATMVDEAGLRFSGGERHRLALARILLQDTPIVLLDEPTVGLDPITEKTLLDTFMKLLKGKTIIWITHHLKGIENADQVIFIENGQIEMSGSPAYLAETSHRFRHLKAIDDGE